MRRIPYLSEMNLKGEAVRWLLAQAPQTGDECITWPFSRPTGYGAFGDAGYQYLAHRFMCEMVNGPRPTAKHQASHTCGNGRSGCVSPAHLKWKTNGENQLDRRKHGTKNRWGGRGPGAGKFTPEMDALLHRLVELGKTQTELAKLCGVTHSTIQYRLYGGGHKARREKLGTN